MKQTFWNRENTHYVLFKGSDTTVRLGILCSNNMVQSKAKFEVLEGLNVFDVISINKEKYWLREYLLGLKVDNVKLFVAVEQGRGVSIVRILLL